MTDKRVDRSKSKVLAETYRQLSHSGISGVSIDEISRRSGVSKTTIYRHWPSRSALLMDACASLRVDPITPDSGDVLGDVSTLLRNLADQLQSANWSSVYPSIIDAAERDPEIAALQKMLHEAFMTPFEAVLERARANGNPRVGKRTTPDLIAGLVGPLFYRRWFSREKIDTAFLRAVLDSVLGVHG